MKKPQYKIGDYVEFKFYGQRKRGFISHETFDLSFKNRLELKETLIEYGIVTRGGDLVQVRIKDIIRKLPILRDKNGRFSKKEEERKPYDEFGKRPESIDKPKFPKNWGKIKDAEGNYHEFGEEKFTLPKMMDYEDYLKLTKTEEKKPRERIMEIYKKKYIKKLQYDPDDDHIHNLSIVGYVLQSIQDYLDEQFEKGKK